MTEKTGFFIELLELLKTDPENRFFSEDGNLLRNTLYEQAMNMDPALIKLLLSHERIKEKFFTKIDDVLIFDKTAFGWAINNKAFLQDSYTRFKNTIGLVDNNEQFITSKNDVVLSFPYKDCILEGGQTKEDQKRGEIFYNETLAPDDVDRLLASKVFTNAQKCTKEGEKTVTSFNGEENLLIKGNNLLALSSILKRYEGKIKCIYIDPPYNTENDSFGYNDKFNHSSWLVFMKNRLELAKKLLRPDGVIFVQANDKEASYLKVLMDEIFDAANYETTLYVKVRHEDRILREDIPYQLVIEQIHCYRKSAEYKSARREKEKDAELDYEYNIEILSPAHSIECIGAYDVEIYDKKSWKLIKVPPGEGQYKQYQIRGSLITQSGSASEYYELNLRDRKAVDGLGTLYKVRQMGIRGDGLGYRYIMHPFKEESQNGFYYQGRPLKATDKGIPYANYYDFVAEFNTCSKDGNVKLPNGKKPEELIKLVLKLADVQQEDYIIDFFAGSGTTCAVAHKLGIKYIGIEQMDYIETKPKQRLLNVLNGDTTGVSRDEDVNWQGGGSFVYCELKELNQKYMNEIMSASEDKLNDLYNEIANSEFISYKVDPKTLQDNASKFNELSVENKQKFLLEVLDKNMLYVNYCDMDDENFAVTEEEKAFTKSFYGDV